MIINGPTRMNRSKISIQKKAQIIMIADVRIELIQNILLACIVLIA